MTDGPLDQDAVTERLLGRSRELSRTEVSRLAGVSVLAARRFWHALGFPMTSSAERPFAEADLQALRRATALVRTGTIDEATALSLTRALARTVDRLASWQVQLLAEAISAPEGDGLDHPLDPQTAEATARLVLELADDVEPMLVYAWRRHLTDAVGRMLADATPGHEGVVRAVGFADLVNFSGLVRQLSERDLARTVERFEAMVTDVVTAHGGRVIKTVGDEVLFATRLAVPAAWIALDLVDALQDDRLLPSVRIGCAFGPVVSRLGDVFGTTVNRAARLTPLAEPGSALVDGPLADALATHPRFTLRPLRRRTLRGVGTVHPHVLTRSSPRSHP